MHSFTAICALSIAGAAYGRVLQAPTPVITPGPSVEGLEIAKRQGPDAISFAKLLLTAIPEPLRQIAATNYPAISSILWEEFLDGNKPWWFWGLPEDVQSYLISQFGPQTATPNPSVPAWSSAVLTESSAPAETSSAEETNASSSQASQAESSSDLSSLATTGLATSTRATPSATTVSTLVSRSSSASPVSESTAPPAPDAEPNESSSGMTRRQKIGVGVGVPFALLGLAALAFGCCFLRRRRRQRSVNGSVPPSSPGFIPRFAFQEKSGEDLDQRHPLNREPTFSSQDFGHMNWDDDVVEPVEPVESVAPQHNYNNTPVMAPALFHTHSSNRARGHRTSQQSYTSLRSVPEVSEPDEIESPVLPRQSPPRESPRRHTPNRYSPPRALIPPPIAAAPQIKRKPVPSSPNNARNPSADLASQNLLRQTMPDSHGFSPSHFGNTTRITSGPSTQVSPLEESSPNNPFSNNYSYVEDYGPEYNDAYVDTEDGLYGHTSLSRYPDPREEL